MGDYRFSRLAFKITHIYLYPAPIFYRYMLNGVANHAFSENELLKSKEKEEKYFIKAIIDKMYKSKKLYYKIWWQNTLKSKATWESDIELRKDADISQFVKQFEDKLKAKKTKK